MEEAARRIGFTEISRSSRVAPFIKIVSRGDTTVADAYLTPVLRSYVQRLREAGETDLRLLTSAGGLPVPLRRPCARASKLGRVVIARNLAKGAQPAPPADDHAALVSVLVAPVVIGGDVAGLVGLINKPGGFSVADSRLAEVFAEMAAAAMLNSRTVTGLETQPAEDFESPVCALPDTLPAEFLFAACGGYGAEI